MKQKTEVKFFHTQDCDYNGSVLIIVESKKAAMVYVQDWLNAHSTIVNPFHKIPNMERWESKHSAIYLVHAK